MTLLRKYFLRDLSLLIYPAQLKLDSSYLSNLDWYTRLVTFIMTSNLIIYLWASVEIILIINTHNTGSELSTLVWPNPTWTRMASIYLKKENATSGVTWFLLPKMHITCTPKAEEMISFHCATFLSFWLMVILSFWRTRTESKMTRSSKRTLTRSNSRRMIFYVSERPKTVWNPRIFVTQKRA